MKVTKVSYEQKALDELAQACSSLADALNDTQDDSYQQQILSEVYAGLSKSYDKLRKYVVE